MTRYNGLAIVFGNCMNHTATHASIQPGNISVLDNETKYKAMHIHCYQCGCIKNMSPGLCPIDNFIGDKPAALPPYFGYGDPHTATMGEKENPNMEASNPDVIVTGPNHVNFDIQWEDGDKHFSVSGDLPPELAVKVMDAVNKP